MEKLDDRLRAVASFVPEGARVADVGSDHAYLAMYLFTDGGADFVIATDKNEGPCEAARATLRSAGLLEKIPVRCGDGLMALEPGEVDYVCIAGMGGELIAHILNAAPSVFGRLKRVVLQPMNDAPMLRAWLYKNGWHIADESLAEVDGRLYEIIAAEPGKEAVPEPVLLELGPVLCSRKPELYTRHVEERIAKYQRILDGLRRSGHPDIERIREIGAKIREMEGKQW